MRKLAALATVFLLSWPALASAQLTPGGSGLTGTGDAAFGTPGDLNLAKFIGTYIISPILGITGILFLVLTVYAGFLWMTSAGDAARVKRAKDILIASLSGAVIMTLAYVITNTVINALSGATITGGV